MSKAFTLVCQVISGLSGLSNIYLLYIYYVCPVSVFESYKYFFLLTALQNILYSLCVGLIVPVTFASDFALVLVGLGPLDVHSGGQLVMLLFSFLFCSSLLIVTNNFVYRYAHVCRIRFMSVYQSGYGISATVIINTTILSVWLAVVYTVFWPYRQTTEQLSEVVFEKLKVNLFESSQISYSLKIADENHMMLCLIACNLLMMLIQIGIMTYSAMKIKSALKSPRFSENIRRMHRQVFTLLLLQTACPISLLYMPCIVTNVFMLSGIGMTNAVSYLFGFSLSLFPLSSAFIIIVFLKEYRRFTFKAFWSHKNVPDSMMLCKKGSPQSFPTPLQKSM